MQMHVASRADKHSLILQDSYVRGGDLIASYRGSQERDLRPCSTGVLENVTPLPRRTR